MTVMNTYERVLSLARDLVRIETVNPPGNESSAVALIAPLLRDAGFKITEHPYGANRSSLVAHKGRTDLPSIMLSGHLDTVPFGAQSWRNPPLEAVVTDGIMYGRGAADMKGGVAVIVEAAIQFASRIHEQPVSLVLSADEEIGCGGVTRLLKDGGLPETRGILIAEPTGNLPRLGHKGVFWLKAVFAGKTAHAAFPERGENALLKAAEAVLALNSNLDRGESHPIMGDLTLVASRFFSGDNYNSVPDRAELGVDIRSTVNVTHDAILADMKTILAPFEAEIDIIFDLPPLWTDPECGFARDIFDSWNAACRQDCEPGITTFYTDGGLLGPGLGDVPVIILGPGESDMAHQTDECVAVGDLSKGVDIYLEILSRLCS